MHTLRRLMAIARPYAGRLLLVALLTSVGALAELLEPWVYRAIINDIAGVFVSRETELLPEILEELRGGASESEAESPAPSPTPDPPTAKPVKPPENAPGATLQAPQKSAPARRLTGRHRRRVKAPQPVPHPSALPPRTVSHAIRTLWLGVLVLLAAAALAKFFAAWADLLAARTTNCIEENFILKTFRHVLRLPFAYFTQRPSGAIARQIDQSDQIAPLYSAVTQEVWSELFTALAILVVIFSVNVQLSLIVLVALLVYALVTMRMTGQLEAHLEEYYELWDEVSGRIQETVAGIKTVHAHAKEDYEIGRTTATVNHAFQTYLRRKRVETRYTFVQNILIYLSKGLILVLGGMRALEHQLTPGDVVMFMAYLDRIYSPVNNLTGLYSLIQRHVVSLHRAFRLWEVEEEERGDHRPLEIREGRVEFRNVDFQYREGRPVLRDLCFTLHPGQVTALIGPSGAGKTTAADLLLGLYRPQQGAILLDGKDLRTVDLDNWRKQAVVVSAEGTIFRDTLAQNIRYARLDATDEEVRDAALKAGLGPALARLPEGMKTVLGERGYELSMGERQRVLLARAFAANPRILILDEATANLDFKTEDAVKKTLRDLIQGRTTLIIAHRQSMLTEVDQVVAIRDGRVIEQGPPAALFGQQGYFFQMMTAQPRGPELHVQ
jgi:ATP-binding cassette subfamily B protein